MDVDAFVQVGRLLGLKDGERVVLVGDESTDSFLDGLEREFGGRVLARFSLDSYDRPLARVPKEILAVLSKADVCLYAIAKRGNKEVSELSMRRELNEAVRSSGGRAGSVMGASSDQIERALLCDVEKVRSFTERLFERAQRLRSIRVTDLAGTDLTFSFSSEYNWLISTGFIASGQTRNILPAEVYTFPADVNGVAVVTGTYGYTGYLNEFSDLQKTLERTKRSPIRLRIKDGRITEVRCADERLEAAVKSQVFGFENGDRVGELGLGSNPCVDSFTGVVGIDEKMPGVHFAHGHGYPAGTGAPYECDVHYDFVLENPTVTDVETGEVIFGDGRYSDDL